MQKVECSRPESTRQSFLDAINKILTGRKLDEALAELPEIIGQAIQADFVAVVRCQPHPDVRHYLWASALAAEKLGPRALRPGPAAGRTPASASGALYNICSGLPDLYGFGKIMAVPVKEDDDMWGYILAASCQANRSWTDTEEGIIKAAAKCISSAAHPSKEPEPAPETKPENQPQFELLSDSLAIRRSLKYLPNIIFKARLSDGSWYIAFAEGALAARLEAQYGRLQGRAFADIFPSGADPLQSLNGLATGQISDFVSETRGSSYLITAGPLDPLKARLAEGTEMVGVITDITERKRAENSFRHQALHDPLTGLPNRNLLRDRLEVALADAKRNSRLVAVLYLDLDFFKQVNDTIGHYGGDRLLQAVASRLKNSTRASDTVARIGGDEFVLVLPDLAEERDVKEVADRVLASLDRPFFVDGNEIKAAASIGVSFYPRNGAAPHTLIKKADAALYLAKCGGRNRYSFYTDNSV